LPFTAVEIVIDVLRKSLFPITAEIKLPLRYDIIRVVAVIGNQGDLPDITGMSEYNVTCSDKRVSQTVSMFLCDKVVAKFIKAKPSKMVAANYGNASLDKGLNLDVRTKRTHSHLFGNALDWQRAPTNRDFTQFASDKFAVCERLEVHEPRLVNGLCHLL
jgi:hypothetical protein